MKKLDIIILAFLVVLVLGIRLYINFQAERVQGDESYLQIRQVEHIKKTLKPIYEDSLSFSGRVRIGSPLFAYVVAMLSLIFKGYSYKLIPNLFAVALLPLTYFITIKTTKSSYVALLTAFISGFIPIFFVATVNSLTVYSLVVPLMAFLVYSYLQISERRWVYPYVLTLALLSFLHPSVIIFVAGLLFYLLIMKLENMAVQREEIEVVLFSVFFVLWSQFIIYKSALLAYGASIIWQNIPQAVIASYFSRVTIVQVIVWVGIIPFLYGLIVLWRCLLRQKERDVYLLAGFAISASCLLWFRLIELRAGLIFLGTILVLLYGIYYKRFMEYLQITKIAGWANLFKVSVVLSFILTSVIPSIVLAERNINSNTDALIPALLWIKEHSPSDAVIVGSVEEGNIIAAVAERKNVIDSDFMLVQDSGARFEDVKTIYTSPYETRAIELLNKYTIDYILFSGLTKLAFQTEDPAFIGNERCFNEVYDEGDVKIYQSLCKVR